MNTTTTGAIRITEQTPESVAGWVKEAHLKPDQFQICSGWGARLHAVFSDFCGLVLLRNSESGQRSALASGATRSEPVHS